MLRQSRARPVRQWAIKMLRREPPALLAGLPLERLLALLSSEDSEVALFAAELLRGRGDLFALGVDRWLSLLEAPSPEAVSLVCELMEAHLRPERVSFAQAVQLAASRPLPVARLGLSWLKAKAPATVADLQALLGLVEAEAEPLRPEIVRWARSVLSAAPEFRPEWVLEFLDSRHADVRAEGWSWLRDEPRARDDVALWQRLLESPYDDVRLNLVADLEARASGRGPALSKSAALDPEGLRALWATVLLNVHRGSRAKPAVVRQLLARVERRPEEAGALLPVLAVALRSVRGPEWRAGLAAVVQLAERRADAAPLVRAAFPELQWA